MRALPHSSQRRAVLRISTEKMVAAIKHQLLDASGSLAKTQTDGLETSSTELQVYHQGTMLAKVCDYIMAWQLA